MDLSKIALPTFVLEPRSLLERVTDFFSHPELVFGYVYMPGDIMLDQVEPLRSGPLGICFPRTEKADLQGGQVGQPSGAVLASDDLLPERVAHQAQRVSIASQLCHPEDVTES